MLLKSIIAWYSNPLPSHFMLHLYIKTKNYKLNNQQCFEKVNLKSTMECFTSMHGIRTHHLPNVSQSCFILYHRPPYSYSVFNRSQFLQFYMRKWPFFVIGDLVQLRQQKCLKDWLLPITHFLRENWLKPLYTSSKDFANLFFGREKKPPQSFEEKRFGVVQNVKDTKHTVEAA